MQFVFSPHYSASVLAVFLDKHERFAYIASCAKEAEVVSNNVRFFYPGVKVFNLYADNIDRSPEYVAKKIYALFLLRQNIDNIVIVLDRSNFFAPTLPQQALACACRNIVVGDCIDTQQMSEQLSCLGYARTRNAYKSGDFAIRGGIIDVVFSSLGYRIDVFGDVVEDIRLFDPATQLSEQGVDRFALPACREILRKSPSNDLLQKEQDDAKDLNEHIVHFYNAEVCVASHLNDAGIALFVPDATRAVFLEKFKQTAYRNIKIFFIGDGQQAQKTSSFQVIESVSEYIVKSKKTIAESLKQLMYCEINEFSERNFDCRSHKMSATYLMLLATSSVQAANSIADLMRAVGVESKQIDSWGELNGAKPGILYLGVFNTELNYIFNNIAVLSEADIFGNSYRFIKTHKLRDLTFLKQLNQISEGEAVVHKWYGVGRFIGLRVMNIQGVVNDFLELEYANQEKLFVPITSMDLISRYGSGQGCIKLDALGGGSGWGARKEKTKRHLFSIANGLLRAAALRKLGKGPVLSYNRNEYDKFCAAFPYRETDDQLSAIRSIEQDMASGSPMDRLVCGESGFGKTEVAMRATFMLAREGYYQVAVLAPTKILCEQHLSTFCKRFAGTNLVIKGFYGLQSRKENIEVANMVKNGAVNVVIGTHGLLGSGIEFNNIGLFIIDEEHRFGVKQKERIKALFPCVHILSMSATPIPRTLQMSLLGVKDLSLLATPPLGRSAVNVHVGAHDWNTVSRAIRNELLRGGSVFYVCPYIKDIEQIVKGLSMVKKNIPVGISEAILHADLSARETERVINNFYNGVTNLLIATPVVEVGIDIPQANTIIVHNADNFGLAQLYQLRGRVGRSDKAAFVYFMVSDGSLSDQNKAYKIELMRALGKLNMGFSIASHDMDHRGFGNLVGSEQSGHIKDVGIDLYQEMLASAIAQVRSGTDIKDDQLEIDSSVKIKINIATQAPSHYIDDAMVRFNFYYRITKVKDLEELDAIRLELRDRFGSPIPQNIENLILLAAVKILAVKNFVTEISVDRKYSALLTFKNHKQPLRLLNFIKNNPDRLRLVSNDTVAILTMHANAAYALQSIYSELTKMLQGT